MFSFRHHQPHSPEGESLFTFTLERDGEVMTVGATIRLLFFIVKVRATFDDVGRPAVPA